MLEVVVDAARVAQQLPDGDAVLARGICPVAAEGHVQLQPAFLRQLQDERGDEGLGDAGDGEDRVVRRRRGRAASSRACQRCPARSGHQRVGPPPAGRPRVLARWCAPGWLPACAACAVESERWRPTPGSLPSRRGGVAGEGRDGHGCTVGDIEAGRDRGRGGRLRPAAPRTTPGTWHGGRRATARAVATVPTSARARRRRCAGRGDGAGSRSSDRSVMETHETSGLIGAGQEQQGDDGARRASRVPRQSQALTVHPDLRARECHEIAMWCVPLNLRPGPPVDGPPHAGGSRLATLRHDDQRSVRSQHHPPPRSPARPSRAARRRARPGAPVDHSMDGMQRTLRHIEAGAPGSLPAGRPVARLRRLRLRPRGARRAEAGQRRAVRHPPPGRGAHPGRDGAGPGRRHGGAAPRHPGGHGVLARRHRGALRRGRRHASSTASPSSASSAP